MLKAYLDTNILVDMVFPNNNHSQHDKAKQVFNQFKTAKYLGVISTLTLTEFAGVCQRIESFNFAKIATLREHERSKYVQTEGLNNYNRLIPTLVSLPNVKIEKGSTITFQHILEQAHIVMQDTSGTVLIEKNPSTSQFSSDYKRAYVADILHVLLAKYTDCNVFFTFDYEIKKLENHPLIDPLKIIKY